MDYKKRNKRLFVFILIGGFCTGSWLRFSNKNRQTGGGYRNHTRDLLLLVLPMTMVFLDGDLRGAGGAGAAGAGLLTVLPPWLLRPSTSIYLYFIHFISTSTFNNISSWFSNQIEKINFEILTNI